MKNRTTLATLAAAAILALSVPALAQAPAGPQPPPTPPPSAAPGAVMAPKLPGIDALFASKPAGGKRTCKEMQAMVPDDAYVPVGVLLPQEGNGPPAGHEGETPVFTFEVGIDPATARTADFVQKVQECTFDQNGKAVWFTVSTNQVQNGDDKFFGAIISLSKDQVTQHPPVNLTLGSGTYRGSWIKAGDHDVVVLRPVSAKQAQR